MMMIIPIVRLFFWIICIIVRLECKERYGNDVFSLVGRTRINGDVALFLKDTNGDGISDIIFSNSMKGSISVLYGGKKWLKKGLPSEIQNVSLAEGYQILHDFNAYSKFHQQPISAGGDFNNDGLTDILFRATQDSLKEVYLIFGKKGRKSCRIDQLLDQEEGIIFKMLPNQENKEVDFGLSIFPIGDINGDKISDLIITVGAGENPRHPLGWNTIQQIYIIYGRSSNYPPVFYLDQSTIHNYGILIQDLHSNLTELSVSDLGDLNRDGYTDIGIGNHKQNLIYIIFGGRSLPSFIDISSLSLNKQLRKKSEVRYVVITRANDTAMDYSHGYPTNFGIKLSSVGDMNGDGLLDIAVLSERMIYLIFGDKDWDKQDMIISSNKLNDRVLPVAAYKGTDQSPLVKPVGDVNRDGLSDLIIFNSGNFGGMHVLYGQRRKRHTPPGELPYDNYNLADLGNLGKVIELETNLILPVIDCCEDFDEDGIDDFLFSLPSYVKQPFFTFISGKDFTQQSFHEISITDGTALMGIGGISPIGDINNDGIADFVVKRTVFADDTMNSTYEVGAIIFGQSSINLIQQEYNLVGNDPAFPMIFVIDILPGIIQDLFYRFISVGDMNGDGFDDFFVGCRSANTNYDGYFSLFYGNTIEEISSHSLNVGVPDWKNDPDHRHSVVFKGYFSNRRETNLLAIDFNGDGLKDILLLGEFNKEVKVIIIYGKRHFDHPVIDYEAIGKGVNGDDNMDLFDEGGRVIPFNGNDRVIHFNFYLLGDLDNDGYEDFIIDSRSQNINTKIEIYYGMNNSVSNLLLRRQVLYEIPSFFDRVMVCIAPGDFNGDGLLDFALSTSMQSKSNRIFLYFGHENDWSQNSMRKKNVKYHSWNYSTELLSTFSVIAIDLNVDGYDDLVISSKKHHLDIYFGESSIDQWDHTGQYLHPRVSIYHESLTVPSYLGDVDNDALPEVVLNYYVIPGSLLKDFFPVVNERDGEASKEEYRRSQSFLQEMVMAVVRELIMLVLVLLISLVLFLFLTKSSSLRFDNRQDGREVQMKRISKKNSTRQEEAKKEEEQEEQQKLL